MSLSAPEHAALLPLLPEDRVGVVDRIEPITLGLSGAGVYAVTTSRGACVLRVQRRDMDPESFAQQLLILKRAAEAEIAPALLHVDEAARAVVAVRVTGAPMTAVAANPEVRGSVIGSVVDRLRVLHALDPSGVAERDPIKYLRAAWQTGRDRPAFPAWAVSLAPAIDAIAATLAGDARRGVNHNDVNPGNVVWDGARAWLVDWEVAGLGHPYFDLATLAVFLRLGDDGVNDMLTRHDGATPDDRSRATFRALRQLVGMLGGLTLLSLVEDLSVCPAQTRADAPSLGACYEAMRAGTLDLQAPRGRASMGLALLAESIAASEG